MKPEEYHKLKQYLEEGRTRTIGDMTEYLHPHRPEKDYERRLDGLSKILLLSPSAAVYSAQKAIGYAAAIWKEWEAKRWDRFYTANETIQSEYREFPETAIKNVNGENPYTEGVLGQLAKRMERDNTAAALAVYAIRNLQTTYKTYAKARKAETEHRIESRKLYQLTKNNSKNTVALVRQAISKRTGMGKRKTEDLLLRIIRCALPIANPQTAEIR